MSLPTKMALAAAFGQLNAMLAREVLERPCLLQQDESIQSCHVTDE